jgi:hypothetical protein
VPSSLNSQKRKFSHKTNPAEEGLLCSAGAQAGFSHTEPPVGPPENQGTMQVHFTGCNEGEVRHDIPSLGLQGEVPIRPSVQDNVPFCESTKR